MRPQAQQKVVSYKVQQPRTYRQSGFFAQDDKDRSSQIGRNSLYQSPSIGPLDGDFDVTSDDHLNKTQKSEINRILSDLNE